MNERRLLNVKEAGAYLGLSHHLLYRWRNQGKLPVVKLGSALRFDIEDLNRIIEENKIIPGTTKGAIKSC